MTPADDQHTCGPIACVGTPRELLATEAAVERLARSEASRAPAEMERRVFAASSPAIARRAANARIRSLFLRAAAVLAIGAGGVIAWQALRPAAGVTPSATIAGAGDAADLEQQMEAWLSVASWTVVDGGADAGSGRAVDGANDFWPALDEGVYGESL